MNSFAGLLLLLSLLMLAMTLRVWFLAAAHSLLWMDPVEAPAPGDSLEAVDREIEQRRVRLADLERSGGSGTWTAEAAMTSHRRRLIDLERWRQRQRAAPWRCRQPITDSTAVHLPYLDDSSRTDVQKEVPRGEGASSAGLRRSEREGNRRPGESLC